MRTLFHVPKWLLDERFELSFSPKLDEPFSVVLFDRVSRRFDGSGRSISVAAKRALKQREKPSTPVQSAH